MGDEPPDAAQSASVTQATQAPSWHHSPSLWQSSFVVQLWQARSQACPTEAAKPGSLAQSRHCAQSPASSNQTRLPQLSKHATVRVSRPWLSRHVQSSLVAFVMQSRVPLPPVSAPVGSEQTSSHEGVPAKANPMQNVKA